MKNKNSDDPGTAVHMAVIAAIGMITILFSMLVGAQDTRGPQKVPHATPYQPVPAVRRLCQADRLYTAYELHAAIDQVRGQGCEQITLEHIDGGYFLVAGTLTIVGEGAVQ